MENKKTYGLIGLLYLIVASMGGNMILTEDQLDHAYICTANENWGFFYGGISSTAYTAYPFEENRSGYKRCTQDGVKGIWMDLRQYTKENNLELNTLLTKKEVETVVLTKQRKGIIESCSSVKCEIKK